MILDDIIKQLSAFLGNFNDDAIDRLHYVYSAVSLSIYLIFITSKQYYGEPIQCVPNSGTATDTIKYMHSICWLNGTYYVEEVGGTIADFTYKRRLNYYQWIIFILIFKVFLFRVPSNIWQFFISLNGFDLTHVTKIIMNKIYQDEYSDGANWQKTQSAIEAIGEHIRMSFLMQKFKPEKRFRGVFAVGDKKDAKKDKLSGDDKARMRENFPNLRTKSVFPLFAPYLAVKLIYLANILFNFWFLSSVFGFDFFTYGYQFVRLLVSGKYQFANKYFPKRSVCFPKVLSKDDENVGTVVCALPINLINEYFYAGYWYWLIALAVLTTASIFYWLLLAVKSYRRNLVLNALQLGPNQNIQLSYTAAIYFNQETSSETVDRVLRDKTGLDLMGNFNLFFNDVCSIDVVFICKLISLNSSSLAFNDVLNHLWEVYLDLDGAKSKEVAHRPIAPVKRPHYLVPIPILSASETAPRSENNDSMRRQPSIDTNSPQDEKSKLLANE